MRLSAEFIRLPLQFDVQRLLKEVQQYSEYEWEHHPLRYDGNTALSLVSLGGGQSNATRGSMNATQVLNRAPYMQQVMASFNTIIGRSRLMRLAPKAGVPQHADTEYAWRNRVRIHIPIVTDKAILFSSINAQNGESIDVHMAAGEAWIFDNWREHAVHNESNVRRIHLVVDTVGTAAFWTLVSKGWNPVNATAKPLHEWLTSIEAVNYVSNNQPELLFEQFSSLPVRPPDEVESIKSELLIELGSLRRRAPYTYQEIEQAFVEFCQDWRGYWAVYWDQPEFIEKYQQRVAELKALLKPKLVNVALESNRVAAYDVAAKWLDATTDTSAEHKQGKRVKGLGRKNSTDLAPAPKIQAFTVIVAAPRAGGAMLFEALRTNQELWSIGDAMQHELERNIDPVRKSKIASDRLTQHDAIGLTPDHFIQAILPRLRSSELISYQEMARGARPSAIHLLDYTPKNALRITALKALFPNAKFVYLSRQAEPTIASIMKAWQSQQYISHPNLEGMGEYAWSLPLIQHWQEIANADLAKIASTQWAAINDQIITDLSQIPSVDWMSVSYEELLHKPDAELSKLCAFLNIPFGPRMQKFKQAGMPRSRYILDDPHPDKWRCLASEIAPQSKIIDAASLRIDEFLQTYSP